MRRSLWLVPLVCAALGGVPAYAAPVTAGLDALAPDGTSRGGCPLEHTDVRVSVAGFVARVSVTQRFRNPFPDPVEAVYTFPLSEKGAVDTMRLTTGDRTIDGEIKRRAEAQAIYDAAKQAGQVAALLDEERPNVFTQRVANLMPGATVEVHLEYVEPLRYADGTFELTFPTVVGPRFSPPGTPNADRVTPPVTPEGTRAGHDIAIAVDVDAGVPIQTVTSALHAIDVERPTPTTARVRLRQAHEIPNRDFVLRWAVASDDVQSAYLTHRTASGDGYVSVVLVPPRRVPAAEAAPKELIFVIDRSGSQSGAPLDKAKETMRWILDRMHPQDTFQVIDFGSSASQLFPTPQPASPEMRRRAREYIDALQADGGTMMADAVRAACATPADAHRLRIVTFMTDGFVGNDLEVLALVQSLRGTSRWFPFGTGNGVNRFLIDGMAKLGGGEAEIVLLNESGDTVAGTFWEKIASPVLTDVAVAWEGLDVVDVFPARHADLWAERPLVIHARYRRGGSGRVVLTGYRQGRPYRQTLDVTLPELDADHAPIASMWARAKVDDLMAQDLAGMQSGTYPKVLEEEIVRVALAHRLLTPFTSFVAVEDRVVNEGGEQRTVRVPVEMTDGVRYDGVFGRAEAGGMLARQAAPLGYAAKARIAGSGAETATIAPAPTLGSRPQADAAEPKDDERDARAPVHGRARRRLDRALLVLVEQGPEAPGAADAPDGWVRVRITLRDTGAAAVRGLQEAGLRLESVAETVVVGLVRVEALVTVAEARGVVRVQPA
jgi:Ca-activated chloride channel family protein